MAVLKADVDFNFQPLTGLAKQFPDFRGGYLGYLGRIGRTRLKSLAGENGVNLGNRTRGQSGKYIVTSDVNKRRTSVKIYSFPLNLFEENRRWTKGKHEGRSEQGRHIIKVKLKNDIAGKMGNYTDYIETKLLPADIKKVGLD
jgi:hypothetical protein